MIMAKCRVNLFIHSPGVAPLYSICRFSPFSDPWACWSESLNESGDLPITYVYLMLTKYLAELFAGTGSNELRP